MPASTNTIEHLEQLARDSRAVGAHFRFAVAPSPQEPKRAVVLCGYLLFLDSEPAHRVGTLELTWEKGTFLVADEWLATADAMIRIRQLMEGGALLAGMPLASAFSSLGATDRRTTETPHGYSSWPEWTFRLALRSPEGFLVPYDDVWDDARNYDASTAYAAVYDLIWKDCPIVSKEGSQLPEYGSIVVVIPDRRARLADLNYRGGLVEGRVEGFLPFENIRGKWRRLAPLGQREHGVSRASTSFVLADGGRFRIENPGRGPIELVLFGDKTKLDKRTVHDEAEQQARLEAARELMGDEETDNDETADAAPLTSTPRTDGAMGEYPLLPSMYEPVATVGRGGFGRVYRYRHKLLDRDFAVKVFAPMFGQGTEKDLKRFYQEAHHLFRLRHRYIIAVHDVGKTENDAPFIRMEFFEGRNLADILKEGRLSPSDALEGILKVTEAIAHAHSNGVFHRDLKASNVLFSEEGDCRVIDFGLSIFAEAALETRLTATGENPAGGAHTAPELREKPKTLDPRTDVFSIGALWYEMLVGRLPSTAPRERMAEECRDLAPDQRDAILRCLEEKPERRFESAEALLSKLRSLHGDRVVDVARPRDASTGADDESASIAPLYSEAVERIREYSRGDKTGWRQLVRRVRGGFGGDLTRWRSTLPSGAPPKAEWTKLFDRGVRTIAPLLVVSLVAADADLMTAVEPTTYLAEILAPAAWSRSGYRVITRAPRALGFVFHHVLGALLVRHRLHADVVRLLTYRPRDPEESGATPRLLIECTDLTGWPDSLFRDEGYEPAHSYLAALYESHDWLAHFFATNSDWVLSLRAYILTASLIEFGRFLASHSDKALDPQRFSLDVPPVFLHRPHSLEEVHEHAFPDSSVVEACANAVGVPARDLRKRWREWVQVWMHWMGRARTSEMSIRFSGNDPPPLP